MSGIPVFSAGVSLQSSGASVSAQIPADSAGMLPLFVRVTATAAGYFRLSQDGASAAVGDLLVQPSDGLILKTCGLSQFSFVSQSGASVVTVTPIDVGGTKYPTNIFTPAALFTTGVNGTWYDPSDFGTMFQDAAGTTPVTAVGQPVGLMLDKSKGLVLGSELVTNGDFSQGTTGWSGGFGGSTIQAVNGELEVTGNGGSFPSARSSVFTTVIGRFYQVIGVARRGTTASLVQIAASGISALTSATTNTPLSFIFPATSTSTQLSLLIASATGTGTAYFDNISVRELPGNHAFNPSGNSANFPVLQQDGTGRYYLAFNGVNQSLRSINSIDFTYGDKMFVAAGVRKLSDAGSGIFAELSTTVANAGTFNLKAPHGAAATFGSENGGSIPYAALCVASGYQSPITGVVSTTNSISAKLSILQVNGTQVASSTADQGTGNYGNYPLYIGARAGTSLFFNGHLYGLVVAGKAASASEIASTEAWLNQKTGAY